MARVCAAQCAGATGVFRLLRCSIRQRRPAQESGTGVAPTGCCSIKGLIRDIPEPSETSETCDTRGLARRSRGPPAATSPRTRLVFLAPPPAPAEITTNTGETGRESRTDPWSASTRGTGGGGGSLQRTRLAAMSPRTPDPNSGPVPRIQPVDATVSASIRAPCRAGSRPPRAGTSFWPPE